MYFNHFWLSTLTHFAWILCIKPSTLKEFDPTINALEHVPPNPSDTLQAQPDHTNNASSYQAVHLSALGGRSGASESDRCRGSGILLSKRRRSRLGNRICACKCEEGFRLRDDDSWRSVD